MSPVSDAYGKKVSDFFRSFCSWKDARDTIELEIAFVRNCFLWNCRADVRSQFCKFLIFLSFSLQI